MKRRIVRITTVALVVLALGLPANGAASQGRDAERGPLGAEVEKIKARDAGPNRFRPASITVPRGTRIRWVNKGTLTHTTTSNTDLWDERLAPGQAFTRRFRQAGTFRYHCSIHPEMTGRITVT